MWAVFFLGLSPLRKVFDTSCDR